MKKLISLILKTIPRHHLHKISHILLKMISCFFRGNNFEDPITGIKYRKLLPYGRVHSRPNALAPDSLSLERHRLIWLYLKQKTNFFDAKLKFLHIAPEYCFLNIFKKMKNLDYLSADLISPWAEVKMDVQNISFEDNTFDVIMANHLLEHVDDDKKAMSEFFRVMKPNGWGIFMVPMDYNLEKTFEDPNIVTPEDREKYYWQSDHNRLYGLDYPNRLEEVGFKVIREDFTKEIGEANVKKYALTPGEIIYLCKK